MNRNEKMFNQRVQQLRKQSRNNRGIALLFALGVMTFIMVIALLFASKARVETKISNIQVENQSAKMLAKSLLPRVLLTLENSEGSGDKILFSSPYSKEDKKVAASDLDYDWIWKMETAGYFNFIASLSRDVGKITKYSGTFVDYFSDNTGDIPQYGKSGNPTTLPVWQYIKDPENEKILARFAFVTLPAGLGINPNAIGSHVYCENDNMADKSHKHGNVSSDTFCKACVRKTGASPADLFYDQTYLLNQMEDLSTAKVIVNRKDRTSSGQSPQLYEGSITSTFPALHTVYESGTQDTTKGDYVHMGWADLNNFLEDCGIDMPDSESSDTEVSAFNEMRSAMAGFFNFSQTEDREAFGNFTGGSTSQDEINKTSNWEWYHRFNLRRSDWDTIKLSTVLSAPKTWQNSDVAKFLNPDSDSEPDTGGIAWLYNWKNGWNDKETSDADDIGAARAQIAANLINYCAHGSRKVVTGYEKAGSDGSSATVYNTATPESFWLDQDKEPAFTGLKRTPYLNEVFFQVGVSANIVDVSPEDINDPANTNLKVQIRYSLNYEFDAEIIDMFYKTLGEDTTQNTKRFDAYVPIFVGDFSFEYGKINSFTKGSTPTIDWTTYSKDKLEDINVLTFHDAGVDTNGLYRGYYGYTTKNPNQSTTYHWNSDIHEFTITNGGTYDSVDQLIAGDKDLYNTILQNLKFKNFKVNLNRVVLKRNKMGKDNEYTFPNGATYEYVDIALIKCNTSSCNVEKQFYGNSDDDDSQYVMQGHFEINDPRHNLRQEDWKDFIWQANLFGPSGEDSTTMEKLWSHSYNSGSFPSKDSQYNKISEMPTEEKYGTHTLPKKVESLEWKYDKRSKTYKKKVTQSNGTGGVNCFSNSTGYFYNQQNTDRDYEVCNHDGGPAWRVNPNSGSKNYAGSGDHISTAYIRNPGEVNTQEMPMESLWELGAIHRAAPWQTLNLAKSPSATDMLKLYEKGGGQYVDGDAPILDQVKMIHEAGILGKINLTRYSSIDNRYFVLGSLFLDMPIREHGNYIRQKFSSGTKEDAMLGTNKETENYICNFVNRINSTTTGYNVEKKFSDGDPGSTKRAEFCYMYYVDELYEDIYENDTIYRRSDILAHNFDKDSYLMATPGGKYILNDANREQIIGRIINHLKVESQMSQTVTAILMVQMVNDAPEKTKVTTDYNDDGDVNDTLETSSTKDGDIIGVMRAGYRRFSDLPDEKRAIFGGTNSYKTRSFAKATGLIKEAPSSKNVKEGQYDRGVDSITGEAKVVATFSYNTETKKWKLVRFQYAE